MDDSTLFMQWAMDTLQHEHPVAVADDCGETTFPSLQSLRDASNAALVVVPELIAEGHAAANSWSSGDTDGSGVGGGNLSSPAAMEHEVWPPLSPNSARGAPSSSSGGTNLPVMSWNFSAALAQLGSEGTIGTAAARPPYEHGGVPKMAYGSQLTRRAAAKSVNTGPAPAPAPYVQDHIIAERKRREKINQRFIELSTVIPGLKKMDKATILSDAASYVKELQEKLKALETAGGNSRSIETVVLVKKPCLAHAQPEENGSPSSASSGWPAARNPLPEIEARFSENGVMVRIHCEDGKGVLVRVLAEVEELHLSIVHANVMPFPPCTSIITITAKMEEGFTVAAEEIVGRLSAALEQQSSCKNTADETGN